MIVRFFHQMGSPRYFYNVAGKMIPWFAVSFLLTLLAGLYYGLFVAPADYQQGESYRIMYIHVPAAWMSMFIYIVMAVGGLISLVWRIKMTEIIIISSAGIGASFTFLALVTGSLWGKPMWGAWWVWDARLTSELLLLFLYLGIIALYSAIEDKRVAARAISILALVGVVNIPIIHFSVEWWNTLHQTSSVTMSGKSAMSTSMLIPLLIMSISFKLYYGAVVLMRARAEILERERNTRWVRELVEAEVK
ncbi:heme ABC transporter permease [Candidatus Endoriftia persephonae]|jgi:heme exporter protein C|uniref:Heme exporter protein C n=4 Tax=Gammaproteobacteria TaxID=1236 RepID=G2FD55_9GAMM|nr:heme ABC transporter permease [Candidatus Endoriftia persephone]EGV52168.1 heme exporter protein C [endosymbiont of Riftia pachyptila (vent Ph05)]EGW55435.1 heme exporter protein C [endosymbiont of Tevnia jerichonana (vent Tica)]KRT56402.1 heme exporter protein CcmC [endosymbiont of Ridgeia piscesae]KRT58576.1 heme exporter protein C [endosymbiont of Ridgeia piscesae]USF88943.1 heme ABC transporter permease [Candidatus Endoriftia persephone]